MRQVACKLPLWELASGFPSLHGIEAAGGTCVPRLKSGVVGISSPAL